MANAENYQQGTGVDINAATESVNFVGDVTADAEYVTIHAETSGAAHAEVKFCDSAQNVVTSRDDTENGDLGVSGAGDIFAQVKVASPYLIVDLVDDSGAANSTSYSIMVV